MQRHATAAVSNQVSFSLPQASAVPRDGGAHAAEEALGAVRGVHQHHHRAGRICKLARRQAQKAALARIAQQAVAVHDAMRPSRE
jgi:hypothetical protein